MTVSAAAWTTSTASSGLQVAGAVDRGLFRLDVEFAARAGEVIGVLGPNGAGKTTLLRALAGLQPLTAGSILLDDEPLDDPARKVFVPAERRRVGVVFQNYRLFPHLTVRDNVAFADRASGARRRVARRTAEQWLRRLDLSEFADRKPSQLSGGQAQRVALARALATEPRLLLLDEPLAALDARTKLEVRGELRRRLSEFEGPTLLVTHDPLEALVLADRLLVIEAGRIVQAGMPAEVARRPATEYVARLVGLNLYTGRCAADNSASALEVALDGGGTLVAAATAAQQSPTGAVLVALRPAAISVHSSRPEHASPRNVWPGTVTGLEMLADRVRVQVLGAPDALVDLTPSAVSELDLAAGAPVWLSAKATEIDVYPAPEASGSAGIRR